MCDDGRCRPKNFSAGSIALAGSMAWNDFENIMVKVVDNALELMLRS